MTSSRKFLIGMIAVFLSGCATSGFEEQSDRGYLTKAKPAQLQSGMTMAVIYSIDGERINYHRGNYPLEPGLHVVHVWPEETGPLSATPLPAAHAAARGIKVEPLTINVEPGARYYIAAVVRRHRTFVRSDEGSEALGPWRTTVLPVVVQHTET